MDLHEASQAVENKPEPVEITYEDYQERVKVLKSFIKRGEAALRLVENEDYKAVILQSYCTEEPERLAGLMASGKINQDTFDDCVADLKAIAFYKNHMRYITGSHEHNKQMLKQLEKDYNQSIEEAAAASE